MHVELQDWKNGWVGIQIGLSLHEIDMLIERLKVIKADAEQHFHFSSDHTGEDGVGDIEIYVKEDSQADNMWIGNKALGPGDEI